MSEAIKNLENTNPRESFDSKLIEAHITKLLKGAKLITSIKEAVKVKGVGKELKLTTKVVAFGFDIGITATVENGRSSIKIKDFDVDANPFIKGKVRSLIREQLDTVPQKLTEYIEAEEKHPIEKLSIENGLLKVAYKKSEKPIMATPETTTEESSPEAFRDAKLEAEIRAKEAALRLQEEKINQLGTSVSAGMDELKNMIANIGASSATTVPPLVKEAPVIVAPEIKKPEPAVVKLETLPLTGDYSVAWFKANTFVQRDGGDEFTLESLNEDKGLIKLKNTTSKAKESINLNLAQFIAKLKTAGSPWSVKPETKEEKAPASFKLPATGEYSKDWLELQKFIRQEDGITYRVAQVSETKNTVVLLRHDDPAVQTSVLLSEFIAETKKAGGSWKHEKSTPKKEEPKPAKETPKPVIETAPSTEFVTPEMKYQLQMLMAEKLKYFYNIDVPVEKPTVKPVATTEKPSAPVEKPKASKAEPVAKFEIKNTPKDITDFIGEGAEFESAQFFYTIVDPTDPQKIKLEGIEKGTNKEGIYFITKKALQDGHDNNKIAFTKGPFFVPSSLSAKKFELPKTGEYSKDWLAAKTYVRQGLNTSYIVGKINEVKNVIQLEVENNTDLTIDVELDKFITNLKNPGSEWSIKPETELSGDNDDTEETVGETRTLVLNEKGALQDKKEVALDFYNKLAVGTNMKSAKGHTWEVTEKDENSVTYKLVAVEDEKDQAFIGHVETTSKDDYINKFEPGNLTIIEPVHKQETAPTPEALEFYDKLTVGTQIKNTEGDVWKVIEKDPEGGLTYELISVEEGRDKNSIGETYWQSKKGFFKSFEPGKFTIMTPEAPKIVTATQADLEILNAPTPEEKEAGDLFDSLDNGVILKDVAGITYEVTKDEHGITLTIVAVKSKLDDKSIGLSSTYETKADFVKDSLIMKYQKVGAPEVAAAETKPTSKALNILASYPELTAEITAIEKERAQDLQSVYQLTTQTGYGNVGDWEGDLGTGVNFIGETREAVEDKIHEFYNEKLADLVAEVLDGEFGFSENIIDLPEGYRFVEENEVLPAGDYRTSINLSTGRKITNAPKTA